MRASPDPDRTAIMRASRMVGWRISIAFGVVVVLAITVAFVFVLSQIALEDMLTDLVADRHFVRISARDLIIGAVAGGIIAIAASGVAAALLTRGAVAPLATALAAQREFVANASHELRTPVAVLSARAQVMLREAPPDAPYREDLATLRDEVVTLGALVDDLLAVAHAREDALADVGARHPLAGGVHDAVERMRLLASNKGVRVVERIMTDAATPMPPLRVERCVSALLDNAIRASAADHAVTVSATRAGPAVVVRVADRGPGIPREDWDRVFARFQHGPSIDDREHGLGLALVRDLVTAYGGSARIAESSEAGTVVELRLPVAG